MVVRRAWPEPDVTKGVQQLSVEGYQSDQVGFILADGSRTLRSFCFASLSIGFASLPRCKSHTEKEC